jgi:hypothetical protein
MPVEVKLILDVTTKRFSAEKGISIGNTWKLGTKA